MAKMRFETVSLIATVCISLLFLTMRASAAPVPWTYESYRAYTYTVINVSWDKQYQETFGPPLPITASADSILDFGNGIAAYSYAYSEVTSSDMYVETKYLGSDASMPWNKAYASFTGTFTATTPVFQYSFNYDEIINVPPWYPQPTGPDPYHGYAFITVDDITTSSTLYSQIFNIDYSDTLSFSTPLNHEIRVNTGLGIDYNYTNALKQSLTYSAAIVPEPISSILFVTGGTLLAGRRYLRRKA